MYASGAHGKSAEERAPGEPPAYKKWTGFDRPFRSWK